jgi:hypothetical protein
MAGMAAVVIGALVAGARSLEVASQQPIDPYGVQSASLRLAAVSGRLPPTGIVGYVSDLPPTANTAGATAFHAAQYVLAPRVLVWADEKNAPSRAIGNFARPIDYGAAASRLGYALEADLGNGVVLYRK